LAWLYPRGAIVQGWQRQRKHAELVFSCMELISVPVIEIAKLLKQHKHQAKIKDLDFWYGLPDETLNDPTS